MSTFVFYNAFEGIICMPYWQYYIPLLCLWFIFSLQICFRPLFKLCENESIKASLAVETEDTFSQLQLQQSLQKSLTSIIINKYLNELKDIILTYDTYSSYNGNNNICGQIAIKIMEYIPNKSIKNITSNVIREKMDNNDFNDRDIQNINKDLRCDNLIDNLIFKYSNYIYFLIRFIFFIVCLILIILRYIEWYKNINISNWEKYNAFCVSFLYHPALKLTVKNLYIYIHVLNV